MNGLKRCDIYISHIYIHNGILFSHKKDKVMPFAATWIELEILILSEVKSERERQVPYVITYMWNLKYGTKDPIYKTEIDHRHGEQTCGCQGGGRRKWDAWRFGISRSKLLHLA